MTTSPLPFSIIYKNLQLQENVREAEYQLPLHTQTVDTLDLIKLVITFQNILMTHPNPLQNLKSTNTQKTGAKADTRPKSPLRARENISVVLRPAMSARLPQK